STYVLQAGDEGASVRVLVNAANASGVSSARSAGTQIGAPHPPTGATPPALSGTAVRGTALAAGQGTWTGPGNQYSYQWQRHAGEGYVDIIGATAARYTLGLADEGATVQVGGR